MWLLKKFLRIFSGVFRDKMWNQPLSFMTKIPHNFSKEFSMPMRVDQHEWLYFAHAISIWGLNPRRDFCLSCPKLPSVPLCNKVPHVFGQARRAVNFIILPCFTERWGYFWWNPVHLNQRQSLNPREAKVPVCRRYLQDGAGLSLSQVKLFQRDLSHLSPPIVFKYQRF